MIIVKIVVISVLINCIKSDILTLSDSYNKFAFDLYDKIAKGNNENTFYSPYSIATGLSMCLFGARNQTAEQLNKLLNINLLPHEYNLNRGIVELSDYFSALKNNNNLTLSLVNQAFARQQFLPRIREEYTNLLAETFKSVIGILNDDSTEAANEINQWVDEKTNGKIKDIATAADLDSSVVLVLINAIYFKANWLFKFDKEQTKQEKFNLEDGSTKDVDMMHLKDKKFIYEDHLVNLNAALCQLPYAGESIVMTIILPNDGVKLSDIENQLDYDLFKKFLVRSNDKPQTVEVFLPKFKFDQRKELKDILSAMGAPDAFDSKANFDGISSNSGLIISEVVHKAIVDVSEEGTEAAAATMVSFFESAVIEPLNPPVFKCNKPFIFFIHDLTHQTILFVGKYVQ